MDKTDIFDQVFEFVVKNKNNFQNLKNHNEQQQQQKKASRAL